MALLADINSPSDLKRLNQQQLTQLAAEVRAFLVEHIAKTGGHLSPNLGVVELTFALHRVFDSPKDAIVWDTGHQAYVHKMVTGRTADFATLRQQGGLSGYPSRNESKHDVIENSHASTSLSYALGLAEARLRRREPGFVIAVIGDGALTGGMAYEALNQIAHLQPPNLIIVINDNGRSYAPTVGGLARHLSQLRVDPRYESIKDEISRLLRDLPLVGATADQAAYRVKEGLKQLLQPSTVFESLGIKYAGLVDGHDEAALEQVLRRASRLSEPVVVHVVTEKGHGYGPAVEDEIDKLHGVSAFDPLTGRPLRTELTYTDVFGDALLAAATTHPDVCAITAAMASSTGLLNFAKEFPDRFFDVGICEQHAVTFAAGLAMAGMRPVVCIYSTFLARAFDQTIMDVALHKLPVVFVIDRAGVTGPDGSSHHGVFDLSYLRMIPNLKVAAPADATELCALLETALGTDGPIAIRYPRGPVPSTPDARRGAAGRPVGGGPQGKRGGHLRDRPHGRDRQRGGRAARDHGPVVRRGQRAVDQAGRPTHGRMGARRRHCRDGRGQRRRGRIRRRGAGVARASRAGGEGQDDRPAGSIPPARQGIGHPARARARCSGCREVGLRRGQRRGAVRGKEALASSQSFLRPA